jgi:putative membrane protein
MKHAMRSLTTLSAIAVAVGLVACGGRSQQQANAPPSQPQVAPEQYGSAMGQPGVAQPSGTETPATPSTPYQAPSTMGEPSTGNYPGGPSGAIGGPQPGSTEGQYGATQPGMGGPQPGMGGPQPGAGGPSAGATGPTGGATMDVSSLDDAQLAAVITAINTGQIQAAQVAATRASTPEVKKFAREMLTQHREMQSHASQVFSKQQITPSDNAISNQLKSDAQTELSTLQGERGKEFDRDYIDGQIRDHNHALELIDRMMANAKSPELRTELQNARAKVENHLRDAERIQTSLQKGSTMKQRGGTNTSNPY